MGLIIWDRMVLASLKHHLSPERLDIVLIARISMLTGRQQVPYFHTALPRSFLEGTMDPAKTAQNRTCHHLRRVKISRLGVGDCEWTASLGDRLGNLDRKLLPSASLISVPVCFVPRGSVEEWNNRED